MPTYPWLASRFVNPSAVQTELMWLARFGSPYSAENLAGALRAVEGMTEMDALVAYLQSLGRGMQATE